MNNAITGSKILTKEDPKQSKSPQTLSKTMKHSQKPILQ